MLLAIDAGNTNIVFAVHDGKDIRCEWRAVTETTRTADEYAVLLQPLLQLNGLEFADLHSAIIATVVPAALFDLRQLCRRYLNCEPLVVGDPDVDLGIGVQVDRPEAVGADRLVNTVAAHDRYKGALVVVDFGTATTFDIVGENGDYEGGVIAPGANLSAEALHKAAAMLPRVAVARTQSVIGKDTVPAMQSGLFWGYIGLIEGLLARIKEEYGKPMTVIATGGLAKVFHKQTAAIDHLDPDLTIRGLILIHARNAGKRPA
ncbi:MAG: type III pantothenate kinase [Alphaproteobacteria bacterium]|nr:type III pantothenate kinase [Alphaproteobacteria bacterium]MDE1986830.1 type III pantothenate kinase [Alphaproteobacteria bacterium]MDE2163523.1 type III pantothenate kinase [Alphaproteobacteria bacterium]MDE2267057.1 type III pantothenate kinase [Alphaproteobacteria bacterium]MDE2499319.1 type III pantothenate kinase [Alphaproteobacteria bacterium]